MEKVYDMIIIGGGPAGYTAALYAARAGLSTLVLEKLSAGGQMALTEQIDNYPGFESGIDGFTLGEKMQQSAERFGAVTELAEVYKVSLSGRIKTLDTSEGVFQSRTVVVATGAIRYEHTSLEYAPIEFPAVADFDITLALRQASEELGYCTHTGVVQCKDSFYGQHSPEKSPVYYELLQKWESWKRLGVKASEMESAAMFVVASALGCRCGSCFHVVWNQEREKAGLDQDMSEDTSASVKVAVEGLKKIIQRDRELAALPNHDQKLLEKKEKGLLHE